ncbi:hypothetical protein [Ferrimonas balearica]|uniref:hypothetical protein n=1 Tax=Ferrimonas balearica TaxID=44012 RepID=UPI001C992F39|nr:hypothetical protein [Ferrimonas balearica]MBY5993921.1 hypothetical protein [Ferrimonas balearica]
MIGKDDLIEVASQLEREASRRVAAVPVDEVPEWDRLRPMGTAWGHYQGAELLRNLARSGTVFARTDVERLLTEVNRLAVEANRAAANRGHMTSLGRYYSGRAGGLAMASERIRRAEVLQEVSP